MHPAEPISKNGPVFSPKFLLAAACCRWPPSEARYAAIRAAATAISDWDAFLRTAARHRILGLVHDALTAARADVPAEIAGKLALQSGKIARQNELLAAETVRLQGVFAAAQISFLVLKGLPLARIVYGSYASKQTRDIDLLVAPNRAEDALQSLEREGYVLLPPAERLSAAQRRAVLRYARELEFRRHCSGIVVELQWRPTNNPLLLRGIDADAPSQSVTLCGGVVRTLAPEEMFSHLCVHGAGHAWSRLKWLADVNALLAADDSDIEHLYAQARSHGAGLCAAAALLLCRQLFELKLPPALTDELERNKRAKRLKTIALSAMTTPQTGPRGMIAAANNILMQFLLGRGWAFFAAQCRIASFGVLDVIAFPLPSRLRFLYPALRLPLWIWRRVAVRCR